MLVGLTLLQSLYSLSEDDVVNRWAENPYWQYLCGETFFQHKKPIARSGLSKWRQRIQDHGMETLLQQTLKVGISTGAVSERSLVPFLQIMVRKLMELLFSSSTQHTA